MEHEKKKQRLEDIPGENNQMLVEATVANDEGGQGGRDRRSASIFLRHLALRNTC